MPVARGKPLVFCEIACSGPAELLDLERFCPLGCG
jgi:hypothetical protein